MTISLDGKGAGGTGSGRGIGRASAGALAEAAAEAEASGFVRTWAMELAKSNITANAILPKALTRLAAGILGMDSIIEAAERGEPIPDTLRKGWGMGLPEDVAPLVVFLASDMAAGITGQCIGLGGDKLADRKSTRLNSSHANISYAVFCLKKKKNNYKSRRYQLCRRAT